MSRLAHVRTDIKSKMLRHNYQCGDILGEGAFGVVFRAARGDGDEVAIKVVKNTTEVSQELNTLRTLRKVEHVVRYIESFDEVIGGNSFVFIVFEFASGGTLQSFRGSLDQTLELLAQVAEAVSEAHAHNIIHRDIKPDNIFLRDDDHALLGDFGKSKAMNLNTHIKDADHGHMFFCAPEVLCYNMHGRKISGL